MSSVDTKAPLFGPEKPPANRFNEDLTQIDSEEAELNKKISETKKEIDYIDSVMSTYRGIKDNLDSRLQTLETQRKGCLMRRNTLLATHNVFGSPPSDSNPIFGSSLSLESTRSILLGKPRTNKISVCDVEDAIGHSSSSSMLLPCGIDLHEMVSGLFMETSKGSSHLNELENSVPHIPNGLESFPPLNFSRAITRECSTPSSIGESVPGGGSANGQNGTTTSSRSNSSLSPVNKTTTFNELDAILSSRVSHDRETPVQDVLMSASPTPPSQPAISRPVANGISSVSNGALQQPQQQQQQPRMATYNAVLSLETSSSCYVYKSLADKSVVRYRFGNTKDATTYPGHTDKVKVMFLDAQNQQFVYTGCDDGKVRCFKADSGSLISEFQCEGSVICLEKGWDHTLVIGTNKGWIYLVKNQFTQVVAKHRAFNWICSMKPLLTAQSKELKNKKVLVVLPMKHKPTLIDAMDGKMLSEIGSTVIESKPCIQVNGGIVIIATVSEKTDPGKSIISVYDASSDWACLQRLPRDGIIAALRTCGHELYVGVKFPSYGHIQCLRWANKTLTLKWIACVAYVNCLAVLPNDIVLNGGPDGSVYNTTPNLKGPFPCTSTKCKCKQPFARRKDLEFHYTKVSGSVPS